MRKLGMNSGACGHNGPDNNNKGRTGMHLPLAAVLSVVMA